MKPLTPTGLVLNGHILSWDFNVEPDVHSYHVYENSLLWGKYIGSVGKFTNYFQTSGNRKYRIVAENIHHEKSSYTAWVGTGTVVDPPPVSNDNAPIVAKIIKSANDIISEAGKITD